MKTTIVITTNTIVVKSVEKEIDLPTTSKFYKGDEGSGIEIFTIIPKFETNPNKAYRIYHIQKGKMNSTDFHPLQDCRSEFFLSENNSIRRTALDLMQNSLLNWEEIDKNKFITLQSRLLAIKL